MAASIPSPVAGVIGRYDVAALLAASVQPWLSIPSRTERSPTAVR